jgi:hypothetical protein
MQRSGFRVVRLTAIVVAVVTAAACGTRLTRQYEYEEEMYLDVDGSAVVIVNASIPALVALRGLDLDTDPNARLDRASLREAFSSRVAAVTRVSRPWRRDGRRFVQIRLDVDDITRLSDAKPFAWSTYALDTAGPEIRFRQTVGAPEGPPVSVGWRGDELVAFRLHLPSRVHYHNARSVEDGAPGGVERGNIVSWEQTLTDRLRGVPVDIDVRMDPQSILYRTLWVFAAAFGAAMLALAAFVWWLRREPEGEA